MAVSPVVIKAVITAATDKRTWKALAILLAAIFMPLGSSLSQILEVQVPEKFYLTPKMCRDFLKKAAIHGEKLPEPLNSALERQARTA